MVAEARGAVGQAGPPSSPYSKHDNLVKKILVRLVPKSPWSSSKTLALECLLGTTGASGGQELSTACQSRIHPGAGQAWPFNGRERKGSARPTENKGTHHRPEMGQHVRGEGPLHQDVHELRVADVEGGVGPGEVRDVAAGEHLDDVRARGPLGECLASGEGEGGSDAPPGGGGTGRILGRQQQPLLRKAGLPEGGVLGGSNLAVCPKTSKMPLFLDFQCKSVLAEGPGMFGYGPG